MHLHTIHSYSFCKLGLFRSTAHNKDWLFVISTFLQTLFKIYFRSLEETKLSTGSHRMLYLSKRTALPKPQLGGTKEQKTCITLHAFSAEHKEKLGV